MPKLSYLQNPKKYSDSILVVEDDETDFYIVEKSFQKAGITNKLIWLQGGEGFIDYLSETILFKKSGKPCPVLTLLDLSLPQKDGPEILKQLSLEADLSLLTIFLLTHSDKTWIEKKNLSHLPYIRKPLTLDKLYDSIVQSEFFTLN